MSLDLHRTLQSSWIHSHEEDEADRIVFRNSGYEFPPSRGRTELILSANGVAEVIAPGPTDRRQRSLGKWNLVNRLLNIKTPDYIRSFKIEMVDDQCLVVHQVKKEK